MNEAPLSSLNNVTYCRKNKVEYWTNGRFKLRFVIYSLLSCSLGTCIMPQCCVILQHIFVAHDQSLMFLLETGSSNQEFHLDFLWWHQFLDQGHSVSFWLYPGLSPPTNLEFFSDAPGSLGLGTFFRGWWITGSLAISQQQQSIAYKGLFSSGYCSTHVGTSVVQAA